MEGRPLRLAEGAQHRLALPTVLVCNVPVSSLTYRRLCSLRGPLPPRFAAQYSTEDVLLFRQFWSNQPPQTRQSAVRQPSQSVHGPEPTQELWIAWPARDRAFRKSFPRASLRPDRSCPEFPAAPTRSSRLPCFVRLTLSSTHE